MIDAKIRVLARKKQPNFETVICNLQLDIVQDQALNYVNTVFHLDGFTQ